jgi:hypothetical protein
MKNYNLLRIVEKIEMRKTVSQHNSFIGSDKNIISNNIGMYMDENVHFTKGDKIGININGNNIQNNTMNGNNAPIDQKCKIHNLPVNSYAIGTNLLFCDKCVQETNLKTYPLPSVKFN